MPEHLLVLGGGYVGLEFAQMFRRFGSRVTVIQRGKQLLIGEDSDIADEITAILTEDGIEILLEAKTESASAAGNNVNLSVTVQGENRQLRELTCWSRPGVVRTPTS